MTANADSLPIAEIKGLSTRRLNTEHSNLTLQLTVQSSTFHNKCLQREKKRKEMWASLLVGVVEASVALGGQSADLLPVGDQFFLLQVDLGGILGVGLLKALHVSAQSVHLSPGEGESKCGKT